MWIAWPIGVLIVMVIGRNQWFARDDWAFLFTRAAAARDGGARRDAARAAGRALDDVADPRLPRPATASSERGRISRTCSCCGRPMSASVVLAHRWMRRFGVTAWISTLMTILLLVFGAGWENLVFAVQIVYNFSLLAFLGQLLLVDHDGPLDRRDGFGVLVSLIGVSSSGFGPFFGFGVGLLLVLRRRWLAAVVAVVPQALAWIWWWLDVGRRSGRRRRHGGPAVRRRLGGARAVGGVREPVGHGAAGMAGDRALHRDGRVVRHGRLPPGADHRHAGDRPRDVRRHRHEARGLRRATPRRGRATSTWRR